MIRVTVELLPKGDESKKTTLGTMVIVNNGSKIGSCGDYEVFLVPKGKSYKGYRLNRFRSGQVINYPRLRLNVWNLIKRALEELL